MLMMTEYQVKRFASKDEVAALMKTFAEVGEAPGTVGHWVAADGSRGWVLADVDDIGTTYRDTLEYSRWLEMMSTAVLPVGDAVPHILDFLG